jgi:hypothetical protein
MRIRLLNTATLRVTIFDDASGTVPRYASISHTWTSDEVLLIDLNNPDVAKEKTGYMKLYNACLQVRNSYKLSWLWIDTVCIDMSSEEEVQEAVQYRFQWFYCSQVCLAYLDDTQLDAGSDKLQAQHGDEELTTVLSKCNWFTRSWTLPELLAPKELHFYDRSWSNLGSKAALVTVLSNITGINIRALENPTCLSKISMAMRISWSAHRSSCRDEDAVYCLLGILGVKMSLKYGEGKKRALHRLQRTIMIQYNDASILAWICRDDQKYRGVMADDASEYSAVDELYPRQVPLRVWGAMEMSSAGVIINGVFGLPRDNDDAYELMILLSGSDKANGVHVRLGIPLVNWNGRYVRGSPHQLLVLDDMPTGTKQRVCATSNVDLDSSLAIDKEISVNRDQEQRLMKMLSEGIGARRAKHASPSLVSPALARLTLETPKMLGYKPSRDSGPVSSENSMNSQQSCVGMRRNLYTPNLDPDHESDQDSDTVDGTLTPPEDSSIRSSSIIRTRSEEPEDHISEHSVPKRRPAKLVVKAAIFALRAILRLSSNVAKSTDKTMAKRHREEDVSPNLSSPERAKRPKPGSLSCQSTTSEDDIEEIDDVGIEEAAAADIQEASEADIQKTHPADIQETHQADTPMTQDVAIPKTEAVDTSNATLIGFRNQPSKPVWPCPYAVDNLERHRCCIMQTPLYSIDDVTDHLWNEHLQQSYCHDCKTRFDLAEDCNKHLVKVESSGAENLSLLESVSPTQLKALSHKLRITGVSEKDGFLEIWDMIFPAKDGPVMSPRPGGFVGLVAGVASAVKELWLISGEQFVTEFLKIYGPADEYKSSAGEDSVESFSEAVLNQVLDDIVTGFLKHRDRMRLVMEREVDVLSLLLQVVELPGRLT